MPEEDLTTVDIPFLRRYAINAFGDALGLQPASRLLPFFTPLLWLPAQIFAYIAARFDAQVAAYGFDEASRRLLPRFSAPIEIAGVENVPTSGPLVVAGNHPGSIDAIALAASVPRKDMKILAYGIPFVKALPHASQHFIFSSDELDSPDRMLSVRVALRHLRSGGALLIFPSGHIGPDPGSLPGARDYLSNWSRSLQLFLGRVPNVRLQLAFLSHTTLPRFFDHPLARRRNGVARQILAQYLQTVAQIILPRRPLPVPRLSFYSSLIPNDLEPAEDPQGAILEHARRMLDLHIERFGGLP